MRHQCYNFKNYHNRGKGRNKKNQVAMELREHCRCILLSSAHSLPQLLGRLCIHACASWVMHGAPILFVRSWLAHSLAHTLTHISATHSFTNSSTLWLCHFRSLLHPTAHVFTHWRISLCFSHWLIPTIPSISHPSPTLAHSLFALTHAASQTPTHSLIHLSMTSFLQLYSRSLISTSLSFCAKSSRDLVGRGVKDAKLLFWWEERNRRYE